MQHYMVKAKINPRAGILVLHAWWGLNQFLKDFCDRLADEGFLTIAPYLCHGKVAITIEDAEQLRSETFHFALNLPSKWHPQAMFFLGYLSQEPEPRARKSTREISIWM